jgi:hypothetical protein
MYLTNSPLVNVPVVSGSGSGVGIGSGSGVWVWVGSGDGVGSGGNRFNCLTSPCNSNSVLSFAIALSLTSSSSLTLSSSKVRAVTFPRVPPPSHPIAPRWLGQVLGVAVAVHPVTVRVFLPLVILSLMYPV